jgi:hypothetical protein
MATPPIVTPARQHAGTVLAAVWADHGWTPLPKLDDFIVCVQIGYRTGAVV